jgi:hypothetical protein
MTEYPGRFLIHPDETRYVVEEVLEERDRQDRQWGEQNHPLVRASSALVEEYHAYHAAEAKTWRNINARRMKKGTLAWDGILREEVHEALAESDPVKARAEWLQVAAVAVAAIECIDRAAMALRSVTHINPAPPVIGLERVWTDNHVPTYADVQEDPEFWISGPGRARAALRLCSHGYTLVDSCPMCDDDTPSVRDVNWVDSCLRCDLDTHACGACGESLRHDQKTEAVSGKLHGDCTER